MSPLGVPEAGGHHLARELIAQGAPVSGPRERAPDLAFHSPPIINLHRKTYYCE
jgi:hypothetical protein